MTEIFYNDKTPMPFGKHRGVLLGNVEPSYLLWLWDSSEQGGRLSDKKLAAYIKDNLQGLKMEIEAKKQRNRYERQ